MRTTETPFLAFWRSANAPLVAIGMPPLSQGEAMRLYQVHCYRLEHERDTAAPVMVLGAAE